MDTKAKLAQQSYTSTATGSVELQISIFPETPIGARLIVEPIDTLDLEVIKSEIIGAGNIIRRKGSKIALSEEAVNKLEQELRTTPQPARVLATGDITIPVQVGNIVKIYLNQCEAELFVGEDKYLLFSERCILTVTK